MFQVPVDVGGVSVRRDARDDRWCIDHETGTVTLRPWRWSERHRLIRACMVDGTLQRQAFMSGLMDLLVQPGVDAEAAPFWTVLCLQLLEVPAAADASPLSHAELLFARHFGWRPADLEDQPAADLDRLLAQLVGSRQSGQPGPEMRREGEWTSIVFTSEPSAVGAWRSKDLTARLEALIDTVARWGGVAAGDEENAQHGETDTAPVTVPPGTVPETLAWQRAPSDDSFPAAAAGPSDPPRAGDPAPKLRASSGPEPHSSPPHALTGVVRLRAPGSTPSEHGTTEARKNDDAPSVGDAWGDSIIGFSAPGARPGSPTTPEPLADSSHAVAHRTDGSNSPSRAPQRRRGEARRHTVASGPQAAAAFRPPEVPAHRTGRLNAMAAALAEAQRGAWPEPVSRDGSAARGQWRAAAVASPAALGMRDNESTVAEDRPGLPDLRDGNGLGSPGSWPAAKGTPDLAPTPGMRASDQASDPFAESAFEERLADVLAGAAREAGIDLP